MGSIRTRTVVVTLVACLLLLGCTSGSKNATPPDGSAVASGPFQATIRRTTDGVPHIVAADWGSLSFGQGYASAEDRSRQDHGERDERRSPQPRERRIGRVNRGKRHSPPRKSPERPPRTQQFAADPQDRKGYGL